MACLVAAIVMTLGVLQGHLSIANGMFVVARLLYWQACRMVPVQ